jgi:hypothetical protein
MEDLASVEVGVRAAGAQCAVGHRHHHPPGPALQHGAKVAAFTAARASIVERVEDIGHLLREGLGDVEAVAANVEEGALVAEAVLEAG